MHRARQGNGFSTAENLLPRLPVRLRIAVLNGRLELPSLDCLNGLLIQSHTKRAHYAHIPGVSCRIHNDREYDRSLRPRFPRFFRVLGIAIVDGPGSGDAFTPAIEAPQPSSARGTRTGPRPLPMPVPKSFPIPPPPPMELKPFLSLWHFKTITFPEQQLETIRVLGSHQPQFSLHTAPGNTETQVCRKQLSWRSMRRSDQPADLRPQGPNMFAPIPLW
jgi:hypothetical protein